MCCRHNRGTKKILMHSLKKSIAARLALGYGLLVVISMAAISALFYFETIGVLDRSIDRKILSISDRLEDLYQKKSLASLAQEINRELVDGIDSDSEIFLVLSPSGTSIAGNLTVWPDPSTPQDRLVHRNVVRYGKTVPARLIIRVLPNGGRLFVGRNLDAQESIRKLVLQALATGAGVSLLLAIGGAILFRHQLERRIGDIRRTALEIEAGDLSRRISSASDDEFGLLNRDINRMLDRIEHLMDGVRHVSNAIAHDLRTPLSHIRNKLDNVLRHGATVGSLSTAAHDAITEIDELILVFDKLLQIAEAESGMRSESFERIDLNQIVRDMVELYDAIAEERQVILKASTHLPVMAYGDRNLLGSALASLIDNAIKYAGAGATVEIEALSQPESSSIVVHDNGPGIPEEELPKVTQRFYRVDQSRNLPGNGLGLSIVASIAVLHGGTLQLKNTQPGLTAAIFFPHAQR